MNITELLHKRVLIMEKQTGYSNQNKIEEIRILEVSPSEKWCKIQNMNGNKYWKMSVDIVPIEVLASFDKPTT